ncbi:TPA: YqcC family protein [Morganella morganii subsp. morganii]|nr:YqcC family protein [Morganella morganii subsp. morganii]
MTKHQQITAILADIENEMRAVELWQGQPPAAEAFESELPFAVDTMNAHEWLQWILIPRLYAMIEQGAALPSAFQIAPYFEEHYRGDEQAARYLVLLDHLRALDGLFA